FNIEPDHDLNMMKKGQSIAQITTGALLGLEAVLKEEKPDVVLVHGDTSTTFAAALSAFYQQIPVGHVEAGLRTYDKYSPFPEEMNRQLTGVLTDLHFAPTEKAREYLLSENKPVETITVTGNTSIDAMKTTVRDDYSHPILEQYPNKKMILLTAHRRENIGDNLEHIFNAIKKLVEKHKDIYVVYPVHLNPKVQEAAKNILGEQPRIHLIEPLDVRNFHNLLSQAYLIMTDSGGIQEEAPSLGVPVLVLRGTTERPEGIEEGTLKLVGTNENDIYEQSDLLLTNQEAYTIKAESNNPYGNRKATKRIANELHNNLQKKRDIKNYQIKRGGNPPILITICNSRGVLIEIMNFAHRGSLTEAPENTISAIKKAWEHGAKGIELDVQLTKDQELVIIHDHKFNRISPGVPGKVNDYTLEEIQRIDV